MVLDAHALRAPGEETPKASVRERHTQIFASVGTCSYKKPCSYMCRNSYVVTMITESPVFGMFLHVSDRVCVKKTYTRERSSYSFTHTLSL